MGEKFAIKKVWMDEEGVSEILGDVLILGMTIVLFAGVFLFIYTFPTPDEDIYVEFQSSLSMNENGGMINVTHSGGETLRGYDTKIYLQKNSTEEVMILNTQGWDEDNPFYGIEGDENWSPGEIWSYFFGGISSEDNLAISIIDIKSNRMVMKSNLIYKGFNAPPIIMERGYYPKTAINNSNVIIFAKVQDPNGDDEIEIVYFNASSLNPELGIVEMLDDERDSIFECEILVSNSEGNYEVTIHAKDVKGKTDSGRLPLFVEETSKPIIEFVAIEPNSVEIGLGFVVRAMVGDQNHDLNFSDITITPEEKFYNNLGSIETSLEPVDEIPHGGIFEASGFAPSEDGVYELTLKAVDYTGLITTKNINLAVIESDVQGNLSYNDTIWAYIGPASLEFKKFYYTVDDPPNSSTTYHLAVFIEEEHIGDDCFLHINIINHYYEYLYIDGNSKIRLLQIGGAASNKDIGIVQNETDFGESVGKTPDSTWYKIPAPEDGDYFHGGDPVSLVFGPFDLQSAKEGDVFGSILVLTGSFGEESMESETRYGQTLPFQAIVIA
ncbi:MAG: type IV pilin N-terminal domain-containing protein [Thermoplasmata archaeon]|nr:MAG: type IV pilin N-terminal domain-containing protein [Thermoplasmata archaeon]